MHVFAIDDVITMDDVTVPATTTLHVRILTFDLVTFVILITLNLTEFHRAKCYAKLS